MVVFGVLFGFSSWLVSFFPMPVPIVGWRKLAVGFNSVITFKTRIYKSYAFPLFLKRGSSY